MSETPGILARLRRQASPERVRRRLLERELQRRGWYDLRARSDRPAIFVGGCGRSGTTLLRELLNRHPRIFCGPETSMFGLPFDVRNIAPYWDLDERALAADVRRAANLVAFADAFYARESAARGKARWADKTPNNVRVLPRLLTWYPHGRFIHLIRDGRDVACSLRRHPRERVVGGRIVPTDIVNPIRKCAQRWISDTSAGVALRGHPRCLEVRYEDLVARTDDELRRVCAFVGEEFDPAMLVASQKSAGAETGRFVNNRNAGSAIETSSVGRWRRDLSASERLDVEDVAGPLLLALGYTADDGWCRDDAQGRND